MLNFPKDPGPRHRLYETMVTSIYSQELSPGDSFIDLGANIGHHTWQMGQCVGSMGRGFAIEPVPDFAVRVEGVLNHKQIDWVKVINVAASDFDGEASFFVQPDHIGWSSMFSDHIFPGDTPEKAVEITVPVKKLDDEIDLSEAGPLAVIKVDVENAEFAALRGCVKTIESQRPVVIFENDPDGAAQRSGYQPSDFLEMFVSRNYEVWSFHGDLISSGDAWSSSGSSYFLASPNRLEAEGGLVGKYGLAALVADFV